jgi:MFS family permease
MALTRPRASLRLIPDLLRRDRDFRRFWVGETVSLFGDQITLIALPLVAVLYLGATPAQMGYLTAAGWVPYLLFSLHAGAVADRGRHRRHLMIAADIGRAALIASVPAAWYVGRLALPQLYVVAFLVGSLSVIFSVSYSALMSFMVPRERLLEANSLAHGSRAFSFLGGPSVGGLLVQLLSGPAALLADAVSFLVSASMLSLIRPQEPAPRGQPRGGVRAGLRFIKGSSIMWPALGATATVNLFGFVLSALFVLYATRSLGVPPAVLGLVLGAAALGGLLGSVVSGRIARRIGVGPSFLAGCIIFPASSLLIPLAGGPHPLVLATLFGAEVLSGIGVILLDINVASIFQAHIPPDLRARVSGAYTTINYGVRPVGSLLGGVLGSLIGVRPTLWVAAVGGLAGVLWLLRSPIARMKELPPAAEQ